MRTERQKHLIELKVTKALTSEIIRFYEQGNEPAYKAILDYLIVADGESLVRLYDIFKEWE